MNKKELFIGFITYGKLTAKYLPYFLSSLNQQTYKDFKILAIDNSENENNENTEFIKKNYPEIEFRWAGDNLGFAKAYNLMVKQAFGAGVKYFLAVNPDMIFEKDFIEKLLDMLTSDEKIAAVAPKILKWDFDLTPACAGRPDPSPKIGEGREVYQSKTNIIDSYGLKINKQHQFFDGHQGEIDKATIQSPMKVFGFTGAAVLFRLTALQDVVCQDNGKKQYFDELMFMYKEDCDLSYRLRLAGWKIMLAPKAVAYHHRSASPGGETNLQIAFNRLRKSQQVKKWSFLNQWILLLKYKNLPFSWPVKLATAWYQFKSLIFVLLFEQYLLKELLKLWKLRDEIRKRREKLKVKINIKEIESLMK